MLKSYSWFQVEGLTPPRRTYGLAFLQPAVGILAGSLMLCFGQLIAGGIVLGITAGVILISFASPAGKRLIHRAINGLGHALERVASLMLLTPVYFVGFTLARAWLWASGEDPLQRRPPRSTCTYWLPCDREDRRARVVANTFTTVPVNTGTRVPVFAYACVLVILLVVSEVSLRWLGFGNPALYVDDYRVGYYLAPHQELTRCGNRISTNSFGMRSPDYLSAKPKGTFRILMLGDSTLYGGSYVDQQEIYTTLLEKRLRLAGCGNVEILNAGVNAWGPFHELGYLEKFGTFQADLAVVCLPSGDIYRPKYGVSVTPYFTDRRPPLCALEEMFAHLVWRYRATIAGQPDAESMAWQARQGVDAYERLGQRLRRDGCEVLFEILPSRTAGTTGEIPDKESRDVALLSQALRSQGFLVSYPKGLFHDQLDQEQLYHDDCHLHRDGHRLYAAYLEQEIVTQSQLFGEWAAVIHSHPKDDAVGEVARPTSPVASSVMR